MWFPVEGETPSDAVNGLTRRRFLESMGIAAGGMVLPTGLWLPSAQAA